MSTDDEISKAIAETNAILAADPNRSDADPTLPIYRVAAMDELKVEQKKFESGNDRMALLAAIRICANHDLQMPDWVARGFIRAYDQVLGCRSNSWDEVFGKPYPGKQVVRLREKREKMYAIWRAVQEAARAGQSVNRELFETIGAKHGVGKTRAEEFYAAAKRRLGNPAKD